MATTHLNEHDANQGAESTGEFLGMAGNSGWYLLGSAGVSLLLVILLWGVFGISLLFCLLLGTTLCLLAVAYVFTLKNNRPAHYDTDFFEAALVEARVIDLRFGPRLRRIRNPFRAAGDDRVSSSPVKQDTRPSFRRTEGGPASTPTGTLEKPVGTDRRAKPSTPETEPVVSQAAYERLQDQLAAAEDQLEEALAEHAEE
jgi:hypothetical protein